MSKEEIVLELTKLSYPNAIHVANSNRNFNVEEVVTNLYNYIFNNINVTEDSK